MLRFSMSYSDLIKFPSFANTTKRGARGWKEAQRQGEDGVTLRITLLYSQELINNLFCVSLFTVMLRP